MIKNQNDEVEIRTHPKLSFYMNAFFVVEQNLCKVFKKENLLLLFLDAIASPCSWCHGSVGQWASQWGDNFRFAIYKRLLAILFYCKPCQPCQWFITSDLPYICPVSPVCPVSHTSPVSPANSVSPVGPVQYGDNISGMLTIFLVCWPYFWSVDHISGLLTIFLVCWPYFWSVDHISGTLTIFLV